MATQKHYVIARDYTEHIYGTASIEITESDLEFIKQRLNAEYPDTAGDEYTDEELFKCDEFWSILSEYYEIEYEDVDCYGFEYSGASYLSDSYEE